MRTTLTLDADVAARLKSEMRRSGRSLKETVNQILRLGMEARRALPRRSPFTVSARELGLRPGLSYDCPSRLIEQIEGAGHR